VVLGLRGRILPDGAERVIVIDGDRVTFDLVPNVELVHDGGWLLPGLVDVHTHPGAEFDVGVFDDALLRSHLRSHALAGVAVVRTPGIVGGVVPSWVSEAGDLPRVVAGGPWLAPPAGFFAGLGREVAAEHIAATAVEVVRQSGGWCKIVVDWARGEGAERRYEPTVAFDVIANTVRAVHAVGGRVAVHTQHPAGAEAAVLAGVDSLEHGMHLPERMLAAMAAQGTALVPTMTAFDQSLEHLESVDPPTWMTRFMRAGIEAHPRLVAAAHEAGVTVLAGTDSTPHGNVAREVALLARSGLPGTAAVGAASWIARHYLGLDGITEGAPADIVAYDTDPTQDPAALAHPRRIVLKGRVVA
jgi:imidazolonepropionase-like amidohydrolase